MSNVNIEFQILPMGKMSYKSHPLPSKEQEDKSNLHTLEKKELIEHLTVDYFQAEKGKFSIPTTTV